MSSSSTTTINNNNNNVDATSTNPNEPRWCPEEQIYIGGVPENAEVTELIKKNDGYLRLFGYGSLCWNPGTGALAKPEVTGKLGRARGYRRCWAQRSTDHRGTTKFPGIVCTLLEDSEVHDILRKATSSTGAELLNNNDDDNNKNDHEPTMTEGVIYLIPPGIVDECLEELDFREKGGYARDVIDVVEDETGELHQALLYRGTPDNPAFWSRALLDLPFAAAIMSVADGPSGKNDFYLNSLDEFLSGAHTIAAEKDVTNSLASMARQFQTKYQPFFLFGCGSNQHNQLLLDRPNNAAHLRGDDAHEKKEIVVCTERLASGHDKPKAIYAGGGHSGLLTTSGKLYLWGWNEAGQCGNVENVSKDATTPLPLVSAVSGLDVEMAALGFSHTLIVERDSKRLYAFGSNERGQANGVSSTSEPEPRTPDFLSDDKIRAVAAGLFHSAVVTENGELVTFGCSRFGQALAARNENGDAWIDRWKPDDNSQVVNVVCGRRHTLALDDKNRIWSFGENNYGQIGRKINHKFDRAPGLVDGLDDFPDGSVVSISCGWSHNIVHVKLEDGQSKIFGWGRNDKGQLGMGTRESVPTPQLLFQANEVEQIACSSESTLVLERNGRIFGCGWNEHGNLATGDLEDKLTLCPTMGEKVVGPPGLENPKIMVAAGGAHFLACMVEKETP